jgi:hypothetical protein
LLRRHRDRLLLSNDCPRSCGDQSEFVQRLGEFFR